MAMLNNLDHFHLETNTIGRVLQTGDYDSALMRRPIRVRRLGIGSTSVSTARRIVQIHFRGWSSVRAADGALK